MKGPKDQLPLSETEKPEKNGSEKGLKLIKPARLSDAGGGPGTS